jgi:hypothetical protein
MVRRAASAADAEDGAAGAMRERGKAARSRSRRLRQERVRAAKNSSRKQRRERVRAGEDDGGEEGDGGEGGDGALGSSHRTLHRYHLGSALVGQRSRIAEAVEERLRRTTCKQPVDQRAEPKVDRQHLVLLRTVQPPRILSAPATGVTVERRDKTRWP